MGILLKWGVMFGTDLAQHRMQRLTSNLADEKVDPIKGGGSLE